MKLENYKRNKGISGRSNIVNIFWFLVGNLFISSSIPGSYWRVFILRYFGADLGVGLVIKPRVRIKFPWKLSIGDNSWIGEGVWIDNLESVFIGDNVCISQEAYLCTGSHDWSSRDFDLVVKPIKIEAHSWVCSKAVVGPGTHIGEGGIISLGTVFTGDLKPWTIVSTNGLVLRQRSSSYLDTFEEDC